MDLRLDQAPVVVAFAKAVQPIADVIGFYAGGSLAAGDFQPSISDLDLVAVTATSLDAQSCAHLRVLHEVTRSQDPCAAKLHCVYVPQHEVLDVHTPHLTWAHGELYLRPLSAIARAELLNDGITVLGPPPADLLPYVDRDSLRAAARAELEGYWSGVAGKPWLWVEDIYVDLGLLTLARAEATLTDGRLITKREALTRLDRFGVPEDLVRQIALRRQGGSVTLTTLQRVRRAVTARRLVALGIRSLR